MGGNLAVAASVPTVRPATGTDRGGWNRYVDAAGTPALNRFEWSAILSEAYGCEPRFFVAEDALGSIRGIAAGYVNPPRVPAAAYYGLRSGLVADDADAEAALIGHVRATCRADGIEPGFVSSGYRPLRTADAGTPDERSTVLFELDGTADEVWTRLRDKTRNLIRKGTRTGLVAEWGAHNLAPFYRVYSATSADKGRAVLSRRFFEALFAHLPGTAELLVAKQDGDVAGGTVVLFGPRVAAYPFQAATGAANRDFAPNPFMVWELAQEAILRGIPRIDMGESRRGSGAYRFKVHFGGAAAPLYYYRLGALPSEAPRPPGRRGRLRAAILAAAPPPLRRRIALARAARGRIL